MSTSHSIEPGTVKSQVAAAIATITFFHPKSNSLPGALLTELAALVTRLGQDDSVRVIVLPGLRSVFDSSFWFLHPGEKNLNPEWFNGGGIANW